MRAFKYAGWISSSTSTGLLGLGMAFCFCPQTMLPFFLANDYNDAIDDPTNVVVQNTPDKGDMQVWKSVARMAGSSVVALSVTCFLLLIPILGDLWTNIKLRQESIQSCRIAVSVQSVTGLLWVITGVLDDQVRNNQRILEAGFVLLLLSSLALMLSFWPVLVDDDDEQHRNVTTQQGQQQQTEQNPDLQPLLENATTDMEEGAIEQAEEEAAYRLLEEHPTSETNTDDESFHDEEGDAPQPTGRLRGTRRLLKLAAPQVRYLYIGCFTLLVRLPFSLSIPHFVSTTLGALSQGQFDRARGEILWLFLLGTIDAIMDFWCIFWFGYADLRIVRGVRIDTFAAILRQEIGFFDKHTSGELASRLTSDCGQMAGDLTWFFRFSIESVVRITGITTYMLIRSPKLGACALSITPIIAIVNKFYGNWLSRNARKVQDALAEANSVAQETFSCVRTVIAFASESSACENYVDKIDKQYRLNVRQTFITGIYYMFISTFLINTVVQGSLLLIGSYMIQRGNLTGEVLLAFMLYQGQLQSEMMNLFQSFSSLIRSSGAGDKVFGLLDRSPPPPATGSRQVQRLEGNLPEGERALELQLDNVQFQYPSRPDQKVLSGISLEIGRGKTVALVGPSGCGKSTIVNLLQRFYDPTQGRILVNGRDLASVDIKELRRRIGVVTQDPTLFSGTILSNITYGMDGATREQAIEAARQANAHEFISSFENGYETEVGERGVQLSGGQKQRIAISRAIIRNPALLLLDEATSALDAESEEIVQRALDSLLDENMGITTVIIAHRLRTVRNADLIAVVKGGEIVESGTHDELMQLDQGYYNGMVQRSTGGTLVLT